MTISATYEYRAISNDSGQFESDDPPIQNDVFGVFKILPLFGVLLLLLLLLFLQAFFWMEQSKMVWESINNLYLSLI